jgi:glucose-1-phosphatase
VLHTNPNTKISTVMVDLGNVVLYFDHGIICRKLARRYGLDDQVVYQKIFQSGIESEFDEGRLSPELFTRRCSQALGVSLESAEFKNIWSDIFSENPPVIALLRELRKNTRTLLLSNTNTWHIELVREKFPVLDLFDALVLSYQVGYVKPHRKFFERALELSREPGDPSHSVFIDDIDDNIKAGRQKGLKGIHYTGFDELKQQLEKIGLLQ